jgi:hypothetical protein
MIKKVLRSIARMAVNAVATIDAMRALMFGLLLLAAAPAAAAEKNVGSNDGVRMAVTFKAQDAGLRGAAGSSAGGPVLVRTGDERIRLAKARKPRRNQDNRRNPWAGTNCALLKNRIGCMNSSR